MLFSEITGQDEVKTRLIQVARQQKVGHALLFAGHEGTGKLALAIAFARYLNCENRGDADSCMECNSCRKYSQLIHPDLHFVFPVASTKDSGKDPVSDDFLPRWRECVLSNPYMSLFQWYENIGIENKQGSISKNESLQIIKKLSFKNFEAVYKVMIIWMAEKMNIFASSKLLKILEEPPRNTLFIIISENAGQIISTIISRCQLIKINKIDKRSMEQAIRQKTGITDRDRLDDLVNISDGNYLQLLEALEGAEDKRHNFEMFIKLMRLCFAIDIPGISGWIDGMAGRGREKQKQFLQYALHLTRGNFMLNIKAGNIDLLSGEEKDFSTKFSAFIHQGNVHSICDELNKAYAHIEFNGYSRLIFFDLALKIAKLLKA
jgi:DNA polymerase III subunit delta'